MDSPEYLGRFAQAPNPEESSAYGGRLAQAPNPEESSAYGGRLAQAPNPEESSAYGGRLAQAPHSEGSLTYGGRLALQQRVLPAYRAPFFDALAQVCRGGLSVFAGQPRADEQIPSAVGLQAAQLAPATNRHLFGVGSPFYRCYQPGILAWLETWGPDALIVEANPRYPNTIQAVRWMHARGRPVIGWGLGAPPVSGALSRLRLRSRQKFLLSLDALVSYSQRGAQQYRQLGFPAERVFVAPNAVTPRPPHAMPERPQHFSGNPKILYVGRLQERKRLDNLLRACAALPEGLQPELTIVGEGPARQDLEQLAVSVYPPARLPGALYGPALQAEFLAADLFVLPGTGGLAVQQAMSYGLPVIVAQGDGTQDDLVRSQNGWQIPPDDPGALLDALTTALADAPRLRQMGVESYRIVSAEINIEQMVAVFVRALNRPLIAVG